MFTLNTYAPLTHGYSIFFDGQLVGAMLPNETYISERFTYYDAHLTIRRSSFQ